MLGSGYVTVSMRIATVVVPVGVYFLILGLLNSRRCPQLLTGRRDFAMLILALCPLFVLPMVEYAGGSGGAAMLACAAVAGAIWALSPRGHRWVIYNLSQEAAAAVVARALGCADCRMEARKGGFRLPSDGAEVDVAGFPLLRNVSIHMRNADARLARRFEEQLARQLATIRAEPSRMAMAMLLVATGMLIAPVTMVAQRAGEIVRILTGMLK